MLHITPTTEIHPTRAAARRAAGVALHTSGRRHDVVPNRHGDGFIVVAASRHHRDQARRTRRGHRHNGWAPQHEDADDFDGLDELTDAWPHAA